MPLTADSTTSGEKRLSRIGAPFDFEIEDVAQPTPVIQTKTFEKLITVDIGMSVLSGIEVYDVSDHADSTATNATTTTIRAKPATTSNLLKRICLRVGGR
jgi:hypothetical protein